jgi:hypothetical protein
MDLSPTPGRVMSVKITGQNDFDRFSIFGYYVLDGVLDAL